MLPEQVKAEGWSKGARGEGVLGIRRRERVVREPLP